MSMTPDSANPIVDAGSKLSGTWAKLRGFFFNHDHYFSTEPTLASMSGIDPFFIPRAPMSSANLDHGLLTKLSNEGYKRGKEITPQTHPELHRIWVDMCGRAGLNRVPQLVLAESRAMNAASMSEENAVMVSTGLLSRLNLREVCAVLGHELGHESSDHATPRVLAHLGLMGAGGVLGNMFARRGGFGAMIKQVENPSALRRFGHYIFGNGTEQSSVLGSGLYIATGGNLGIVAARQFTVHPTELDADRKGAAISGDPEGLASALMKLEGGKVKRTLGQRILHGVHFIISGYPSTENRIAKLHRIAREMPPEIKPAVAVVETMAPTIAMGPKPQVSAVESATRVSTPEHVASL